MKQQKNRWVILVAAIITNLALGAGYAWSVFQTALLEQNTAWSLSETSLAFSISFAMVPVAMIICGPILDKYGGQKVVLISGILFGIGMFLTSYANSIIMLYLTYGVILGLGIGAGYGTATALTVKWFPDKKGLAGGLTAAGFGSGAIILAPIATSMIGNIGINMTFRVLEAVLLVVICAASFLMENPPMNENATVVANNTDKDYKQMLRESNFWILWVIYTFAATSGMMVIGHAANIASTYSIGIGTGAVIVMIVGFANTLGRIFWGTVSDKVGRYKTLVLMFIVSAVGLMLVNFTDTLGAFAGIVGLVGIALSFGGFLGSFPGITAENWGASKSASNYGWMFIAYGIAAVFGILLTMWYMKRISQKETPAVEVK